MLVVTVHGTPYQIPTGRRLGFAGRAALRWMPRGDGEMTIRDPPECQLIDISLLNSTTSADRWQVSRPQQGPRVETLRSPIVVRIEGIADRGIDVLHRLVESLTR
jgi:hypothetical protein